MERFVQSLAEGLVAGQHRVVAVSAAPRREIYTDLVNGVKTYYVSLRNFYWPFGSESHSKVLKSAWHALDTYNAWMGHEVARILERERPALVHTNGLGGFSVSAWRVAKRRGLPTVHTLHDYYLLCPKATMFRNGKPCSKQCPECRVYAFPRKTFSNQVNAVVGVSQYILDLHLHNGYFASTPEKRVIPNAYEKRLDEPAVDHRSLPIRFGFLGQLDPTKGIENLLTATEHLPTGAWKVQIAGRAATAAYEHHLRAKYVASGIEFLGYVTPENYFPRIDVLVVPSLWHEPFGRIIIEAYAHGVPVIGSVRGAIPELVEDGHTGFLFEPNREGDLAAKMKRYIDKPILIDSMRHACLDKAKAFRLNNIINQYLEMYETVTAAP